MNKAPPGVWYALHVHKFKSKYPIKEARKRKRKAPAEFNDGSQLLLMKDCDDWAVEVPWAKCKQILHPAIGETSMSFKGFIVSKLFTGKTLHICTWNKKVGVIQGRSRTERCSICSPAVCSYGSMLLTEGDLAEHRSLTSLLSWSRCGFGLFFYSFFSLMLKTTLQNCFFCEREQLLPVVFLHCPTKMVCQRKQTRDWQRPISSMNLLGTSARIWVWNHYCHVWGTKHANMTENYTFCLHHYDELTLSIWLEIHSPATLLETPCLYRVGPPFAFRTALILRGIDQQAAGNIPQRFCSILTW